MFFPSPGVCANGWYSSGGNPCALIADFSLLSLAIIFAP
jgi:hypothetical protein